MRSEMTPLTDETHHFRMFAKYRQILLLFSKIQLEMALYRGSYKSAQVLLTLLKELGEIDKMRGLSSILSLIRNESNAFNNAGARMLDTIYHMTLKLF